MYYHTRGSTSFACKVQIKLGCKPGCCPARGGLLTKCQGTTGHVRRVSKIWEPNYTLQIFKSSQGCPKMRGTHFFFKLLHVCRKHLFFCGSLILRHPGKVIVGCTVREVDYKTNTRTKFKVIRRPLRNHSPKIFDLKSAKPTRPVPSSYMRLNRESGPKHLCTVLQFPSMRTSPIVPVVDTANGIAHKSWIPLGMALLIKGLLASFAGFPGNLPGWT